MDTGKKKRQVSKLGRALAQVCARDARLTQEWPNKKLDIVAQFKLQGLEAQLTPWGRYDAWHIAKSSASLPVLGTNEQLDIPLDALRQMHEPSPPPRAVEPPQTGVG